MENIDLDIKVYQLDDIPLILNIIEKMNIVSIIDNFLPVHGLHQGLSNGWLTAIWLCHILTTSNHAKCHVREWSVINKDVLELYTGQKIREVEFDDCRLSLLLKRLSKKDAKESIETNLFADNLYLYNFKTIHEQMQDATDNKILTSIHIDTTTTYGYHTNEDGIMQYGHSKDHRPDLLQMKLLAVAIKGKLLHHQTYSGDRADDNLYYPAIEQVQKIVGKDGGLYVGDCKIAALETRAKIAQDGNYYLTHLPENKGNKEYISSCIENIINSETQICTLVYKEDVLLGGGYNSSRNLCYKIDNQLENFSWNENIFLFRSLNHYASIKKNLDKKLLQAIDELKKLTPAVAKGKRQICEEEELKQKTASILKDYNFENVIDIKYEAQTTTTTRFVGKGRGGNNRATKEIQTKRYQITSVTTNEQNYKELLLRKGWIVYVSNVPTEIINLNNAILTYRQNYHLENKFHILKDKPLSISPLYVHKDEQIIGLTNLLMLAFRIIEYLETTLTEQIAIQNKPLKGLYESHSKKLFYSVTFVTLLSFFTKFNISLTVIYSNGKIIK